MAFKMEGFSGFKKHPLYGKLDAEEKKRYDSLDKSTLFLKHLLNVLK